jgi:hypothetical protein
MKPSKLVSLLYRHLYDHEPEKLTSSRNRRILSILFAKLLLGEKVKLIVDGTILEVANLNRARTQRIKRSGKAFWGKRGTFIVSITKRR